MITLLAKSPVDMRYYFTEDNDSVFLIKEPLKTSKKVFIDKLPIFLRKSFDTDLVYDDKAFEHIDELREYAINDSKSNINSMSSFAFGSLDDLLIYAPIDIVEEYLELIQKKIGRNDFTKIELFFRQLSRNIALLDNEVLQKRKHDLWIMYKNAIFSNIVNMQGVEIPENRMQRTKCVFAIAV